MAGLLPLVVFELGGNTGRFSLHLDTVLRVARVVAITPLPKAPAIVLGVINVEGRVIPVVSLRRRFGAPEPAVDLNDQIIVAQTPRRALGLLVSRVMGVVDVPGTRVTPHPEIVPGLDYVEGIAKLEGDIICIHDLAACLSLEEERELDEALEADT